MKPRHSFRRIFPAAALAPLVLTFTLAAPAFAANWQGDDATSPDDWHTAENWNTGGVPGVGDTVGEGVTFAAANNDIIDINGTSVSVGAFTIGANAQTFANSGAAATITCTSLTMGANNGDDYNHIFWPNFDINGTFVQQAKTGGLTFRGSLEVDTLTGHGANYITTYGPFTINDPNPITVTPNTAITSWGGAPGYNLYDVLNCAGMTLMNGAWINAYAANSLGGITGALNVSTNGFLILRTAQTTYPSGGIEIGPYALLGGDTGSATWGPGNDNDINILTDAVLAISAGTEPTTGDIGADAVWKAHMSATTTTAGANGTTIYKGISIGNYGYPSSFALNGSTLVAPAGAGDVEVLVLSGLNHNNNNSFSIESVDQTGVANFHCRGTLVAKGFRINASPNANSCTTFNFIGESGNSRASIVNFDWNPWTVAADQTYNFSGDGLVLGEVDGIQGHLTLSDVTFSPKWARSTTVTRYDGTKLTFNDGAALVINDTNQMNFLESLDADQVVVNGTTFLVQGNTNGAYPITAAANPRLYDFMTKSHVCIYENNNNTQRLQGDGIVLGDGKYLLSWNDKGTKTLYSADGHDAKIRGVGGADTSMGIAVETNRTLVLYIPIDGNGAALKLNNDTEMTLVGGNFGVHNVGRKAQAPRGTITLNDPITNVPSLTVLNGIVNLNAGVSVPPTMDLMVASGGRANVNTPVTVDIVGGNGTVSSATNLTFDTVAPGGSVGSLNLGSFTMPVDATYQCEIGGDGGGTPVAGIDHDLITGTTVTFAGGWNLHLVNNGLNPGDLDGTEVFKLVDATSIVDFADPTLAGSGFDFSNVSFSISNGDVLMTGLLVAGPAADYIAWAANFPGADLSDPEADYDGDGQSNDYERIFGLDPTNPASVNPISVPLDPAAGTLSFTRRDPALSGLVYSVWTSTDLVAWTEDEGAALTPGAVVDEVQTVAVQLSAGLLAEPKLFLRLAAVMPEPPPPPPPLLGAAFEDDDGGFTVSTAGGTSWTWGAPNSPDQSGGAVTAGAGGSAKCWGTNLTGGYLANTDTALRSPVIDLTAVAGAKLSFARSIDANTGHTLTVNVIEAATDTVIANVIPAAGDPNPGESPWQKVGPVALPAEAIGKSVRVEWRFTGDGNGAYNGVYIDDVVITP